MTCLGSDPAGKPGGMTIALVLDVDGTLVDTNYHHTIAWFRAFRSCDVSIPTWRIHRAIGMGGDQLVPEVAGDDVESELGDRIRAVWKQEADALLDEIRPFDGATELLDAAADAGYQVVLASSGKPDHVERYLDLLDARDRVHAWTSSADAERSKPAPDLVHTALEKSDARLGVVVGDSVWDCVAAHRAGLPSVGLRTGGFGVDELVAHGASPVYDDLHALRAHVAELPHAPRVTPAPAG